MNKLTEPPPAASTETDGQMMHFDGSRWCIGDHEMHCGEVFYLYPDRKDLPQIEVRIEHCNAGWYLITPYGITQLSKRRAKL